MEDSVKCESYDEVSNIGFPRYGNFSNYYNFHPAEQRIRLLPDYLKYLNLKTKKLICLDVGCNVGVLTRALHKHMTTGFAASNHQIECHILGVDLDQSLIEQANNLNDNKLITFVSANVLTDTFEQLCQSYLQKHDKEHFDVIYCFSITMWIHINYGDEGLEKFLKKLSEKTGMLIIEPQLWKCYTRAVRKMKRSNREPFTEFIKLKIRNDVESYIDSLLCDTFSFVKILHSAPTTWGRQINIYKKDDPLKRLS